MEPSDNFNFNLFSPRNLHGRKNRNVIITMLIIWATAVFGFQILLKTIEKPTPEKSLVVFESVWPEAISGNLNAVNYKGLLNSVILVKGKNTVKPEHQKILNSAISCITFSVLPDSLKSAVLETISEISATKISATKQQLPASKDQEFLDLKSAILIKEKKINEITSPYTGILNGSLEEKILTTSLSADFPGSLSDESLSGLPQIMNLYLMHNQSILTDIKVLGFPFHYFYTAVFLLLLFIDC
ncbi:MAG: DUF4212 domain-containing protein [Bacteroidales bacterium]|nr:DUF4212 domain-containing protein [Bacteroidales bacterium]